MYSKQVHFRCDKEMKLRLDMLDDHSAFIRDAITEKWIREHDPKVVEAEIKEHEKAIRELRQDQTKAKELPNTDQILQKYYNLYKSGQIDETDVTNIHKWIRAHVLPDLAKAGRRDIDSHQVLEVFSGMDKKKGGE